MTVPRSAALQAYWTPHVRKLLENEPHLRNAAILEKLSKYITEGERRFEGAPWPVSERTVARIRAAYSPKQRQDYRYFTWPNSMDSATDLPWEASQSLLELFAWLELRGVGPISERTAKWFWRASLAAPDATILERLRCALVLAGVEGGYAKAPTATSRRVTMRLAFGPWRSPRALAAYEAVTESNMSLIDPIGNVNELEPHLDPEILDVVTAGDDVIPTAMGPDWWLHKELERM